MRSLKRGTAHGKIDRKGSSQEIDYYRLLHKCMYMLRHRRALYTSLGLALCPLLSSQRSIQFNCRTEAKACKVNRPRFGFGSLQKRIRWTSNGDLETFKGRKRKTGIERRAPKNVTKLHRTVSSTQLPVARGGLKLEEAFATRNSLGAGVVTLLRCGPPAAVCLSPRGSV